MDFIYDLGDKHGDLTCKFLTSRKISSYFMVVDHLDHHASEKLNGKYLYRLKPPGDTLASNMAGLIWCSSMSHPSESFIYKYIVPIFSDDFHMKKPSICN